MILKPSRLFNRHAPENCEKDAGEGSGVSRRRMFQGAGVAAVAVGAGMALAACGSDDKSSGDATTGAAPTGTGDGKRDKAIGDPAQVTQPAAGVDMFADYAKTIGQFAYVWGWPLVNMRNRHDTISKVPQAGRLNNAVPVAPQGHLSMLSNYVVPEENVVACPNQDVVYGAAFLNLDAQPVIVQVPDFGDRFWVYALYNARLDQFGELGKQYGTKPGFYLLAGPNWQGDAPKGVEAVIRSTTTYANALPRIFMDATPEDHTAIQAVINQVNIYPLTEFDGKTKITDWSQTPALPGPPTDGGETKYVIPEQYFDQLGTILDSVPPLPGEEALYAQFRSLLDAARRDPALRQALIDTAVAAEKNVIAPFFEWKHNGVPAGNGWNRSANNAQFGVDYFSRTGTSKSNIFENRPTETQYFYTDNDTAGAPLDGTRTYSVTFPAGQEPPVKGFWSLTVYNNQHLFSPNPLNRYSLGTKNKNLARNPDGSLTLHIGPQSPTRETESNWIPTPSGPFSLYIRAYWGDQAILDGSWKPPAITPA
ncbi:DUF1254 domain-containing protein [Nocardia sp. NPDC058058]|uniref:DUF1254 domain-containing protein n=1 Tax=Nocardia sp. NPDC058058 TaxID=3346317 RepID=UPI0036DABD63